MNPVFTKCVTIRCSEYSDLIPTTQAPEKWMKCFKVVANQAGQELSLSSSCDWNNMGNSQVVLHIDPEQPRMQILPFLFTRVHGVYLVVFDLKDRERALAYIQFAMANIVAYALCCERSEKSDESCPKVYLVCKHPNCEVMCKFENELKKKLHAVYMDFIKRNNERLCWNVAGADLDIQSTGDLAEHIQGHSSSPDHNVCKWISSYCDLVDKAKVMVYSDVKHELQHLSEEELCQCLSFLHNYGFIFYQVFDNLEVTKQVVVLQPQYLSKVVSAVQSMCRDMPKATISDFLSSTHARGPIRQCMHKWFQRVCTDMGLAIEFSAREFIFVSPDSPSESAPSIYSVDPLLLTLRHFSDGEEVYFVPVAFFTKFVSYFLRALRDNIRQMSGNDIQGRLNVSKVNQHTVHVIMPGGKSHIYLREQKSCIEIGIREVLIGSLVSDEEIRRNRKRLRKLCEDVKSVVEKSIKGLKLGEDKICNGFYVCHDTRHFAPCERDYVCHDQYHLCIRPGDLQRLQPHQEIWFKDVSEQQVS